MRLRAFAFTALSIFVGAPALAAQVDAATFNNALRKYGEGYYEFLVESDRCDQALSIGAPVAKQYCGSFKLAFEAREAETQAVGRICADMLDQVMAGRSANTPNGREIAAACSTYMRLTGRERYGELKARGAF